jgi:hypothetical protein
MRTLREKGSILHGTGTEDSAVVLLGTKGSVLLYQKVLSTVGKEGIGFL